MGNFGFVDLANFLFGFSVLSSAVSRFGFRFCRNLTMMAVFRIFLSNSSECGFSGFARLHSALALKLMFSRNHLYSGLLPRLSLRGMHDKPS